MIIKNYTPHDINIMGGATLKSLGVARVEARQALLDELDFAGGVPFAVPLYRQCFGQVTGLPEATCGTIFIVPQVVANTL